MALEAINKIQKAESTASLIFEKAVEESNSIISNANTKGEIQYNVIVEDAMIKAKLMRDNAVIKGEEDSQPSIVCGEKEVDKILNISQAKIDLAVNLVIERIVKFNGNS